MNIHPESPMTHEPITDAERAEWAAEQQMELLELAERQVQGGVEVGKVEQSHPMMGSGFMHVFSHKEQLPEGTKLYTASPSASVGVSSEDLIVLMRLKDALPDVGLNGWIDVVRVIERILAQQAEAAVRLRFRKAPCYLCGYDGAGYFQPETHPCAVLYHAAACYDNDR